MSGGLAEGFLGAVIAGLVTTAIVTLIEFVLAHVLQDRFGGNPRLRLATAGGCGLLAAMLFIALIMSPVEQRATGLPTPDSGQPSDERTTVSSEPSTWATPSVVTIEGSLGVANQTRGDRGYASDLHAEANDRIVFQAYYNNRELVGSGRYASNLTVAFIESSTRGREQYVGMRVFGDNTNVVEDTVSVYVPEGHVVRLQAGSVLWRHNVGSDREPRWVDHPVGDEVFGRGAILEDAGPCLLCNATVSVVGIVAPA